MCQVTAITHTNALGLLGALLQAHAIRRVISIASSNFSLATASIDPVRLIDDLIGDLGLANIHPFVSGQSGHEIREAFNKYREKLEIVKRFVTQELFPDVEEVVAKLGKFNNFMNCLIQATVSPHWNRSPLHSMCSYAVSNP